MKKIFLTLLIISLNAFSNEILLKDVPYEFDKTKVLAAKNSFHFMRSFVDYYYLLIKENKNILPEVTARWDLIGWCAGDAHPENFGVLLGENNTSQFTINDWDDSGACPVYLDIFRLIVSSKLYNSNINVDEILKNYSLGLNGGNLDTPTIVQSMFNESALKGAKVNPKKVTGNQLIRNPESSEVSADEKLKIEKIIDYKILDIINTEKVGGGSGGLKRFEILIEDLGVLVHLELKNEIVPSLISIQDKPSRNNSERFKKSFSYFMPNNISKYYNLVQIDGLDYLMRPRFHGNVGVNISEAIDFKPQSIINYEAYVLGKLHSKSLGKEIDLAVLNIDVLKIKNEVDAFVKLIQQKFDQLKQ